MVAVAYSYTVMRESSGSNLVRGVSVTYSCICFEIKQFDNIDNLYSPCNVRSVGEGLTQEG